MFQFSGTFESRKYLIFEAWRNESNYLFVIPPGSEIFFNYDWIYTYSSTSAPKWETQNCALLEIRTM